MCGIAGFTTRPTEPRPAVEARLRAMTASLRHRGPDAQRGVVLDGAALGHTRLSIIDLTAGHQPMHAPERGLTIVFNGEIYNHLELREQLRGWTFRTHSDTEVILAAFDAWGIDCVRRFVGQFAFALWDSRHRQLWLARDRVGVRPLFVARTDAGGFAFASEAKALFASGSFSRSSTPGRWPRRCTCGRRWPRARPSRACTSSPRATWRSSSRAGTTSAATGPWTSRTSGSTTRSPSRTRWSSSTPPWATRSSCGCGPTCRWRVPLGRARLVAPLRAGAAAARGLAADLLGGFEQSRFDERPFQQEVADALETAHASVPVGDAAIGALLPKVIWHAEQVLLRSAPAPFFALSALVRSHGTKVVLTGEGADEIFLGYDLFKETAIRRFWARAPNSTARPKLFLAALPYLSLSQQSSEVLRTFFGSGLEHPERSTSRTRSAGATRAGWRASSRQTSWRGWRGSTRWRDAGVGAAEVKTWRPLARAQYLEFSSLLSGTCSRRRATGC